MERFTHPTEGELYRADPAMAVQIDNAIDGVTIYVGQAPIGSATSDAKWQIKRLDISGTSTVGVVYASGNNAYDKVWDNRTGYTYS